MNPFKGEQQLVNIVKGFVTPYPLLLLDKVTASFDKDKHGIVIELIKNRIKSGIVVVSIFHDKRMRNKVSARVFHLQNYKQSYRHA